MKMNKFFSFAIATVMSFSLFGALTVNAAVVNDQKVIDVVVAEPYTSDGFDVYVVDFVATNLDFTGEKQVSGPKKGYKGRSVVGAVVQFELSVDGKNNTLDSESFVLKEASAFSDDEPAISDAKDVVTISFGGTKTLFPTMDNVSIAAKDRTSLYTAQVWVPEGSTAVMTFTEGCAINTLYFDGVNGVTSGDSSVLDYKGTGCVTKTSVTLGAAAPTTETKYFAASFVPGVKSAANNAIEFSFKDGDKEGKKAVYYGDVVMENLESVVTAVEVTEVPEKSALELVGTAWTTIVK